MDTNVIQQLLSEISAMGIAEVIAVILALGYVILAAKQHILCWFCALFSTLIYVWIFWEVSLPFQMLLNAYYVVMAVYGFWQWKKRQDDQHSIRTLSTHQHALIIVGIVILTGALGVSSAWISSTPFVYVDAFVTTASIVTTVLVAHKVIENWLYWLCINAVACWLYFQVDLVLTGFLFGLYCVLSIYGYQQWRRSYSLSNQ